MTTTYKGFEIMRPRVAGMPDFVFRRVGTHDYYYADCPEDAREQIDALEIKCGRERRALDKLMGDIDATASHN